VFRGAKAIKLTDCDAHENKDELHWDFIEVMWIDLSLWNTWKDEMYELFF